MFFRTDNNVCFSERSLRRLALLLDHYGLDMKDLSPEQRADLPAALKQLQLDRSYGHRQTKGLSTFNQHTQFDFSFKGATCRIFYFHIFQKYLKLRQHVSFAVMPDMILHDIAQLCIIFRLRLHDNIYDLFGFFFSRCFQRVPHADGSILKMISLHTRPQETL